MALESAAIGPASVRWLATPVRDTIATITCRFDVGAERSMSVELRVRSESLTWSNPVARWWTLLTLVSGANIAIWFLLYREFHTGLASRFDSSSSSELMLLLSAAYVFGCAFRSLLPRADVQRICLFDTWLSSVVVGRAVATLAELCFAAQWTIVLLRLGTMTGSDTPLNGAFAILT